MARKNALQVLWGLYYMHRIIGINLKHNTQKSMHSFPPLIHNAVRSEKHVLYFIWKIATRAHDYKIYKETEHPQKRRLFDVLIFLYSHV